MPKMILAKTILYVGDFEVSFQVMQPPHYTSVKCCQFLIEVTDNRACLCVKLVKIY